MIPVLQICLFPLHWVDRLGVNVESFDITLCVGSLVGSNIRLGFIYRNCSLSIGEFSIEFDLIVMKIGFMILF